MLSAAKKRDLIFMKKCLKNAERVCGENLIEFACNFNIKFLLQVFFLLSISSLMLWFLGCFGYDGEWNEKVHNVMRFPLENCKTKLIDLQDQRINHMMQGETFFFIYLLIMGYIFRDWLTQIRWKHLLCWC